MQSKIVQVDDGEAVATRVKTGHGREFGFGGYTDVLHNQDQGGVKLVGPIPEEVQNYTMYSSALVAAAPSPAPARAFLTYLETPEVAGDLRRQRRGGEEEVDASQQSSREALSPDAVQHETKSE